MEKLRNTNIDTLIFRLILVCGGLFLGIAPFRNTALRRAIVFVGSSLFYIAGIRCITATRKITKASFVVLCMILNSIIIGSVQTYRGHLFELIYQCLNFLALFIIITIDGPYVMNPENKEFVHLFSLIASIEIIIGSIMPGAYIFEDGRQTGALTLGMTNPNFTAMMIGAVYNLFLISFKEKRKIWMIPIMVWLLRLLVLTEARSCLIMALLVTVYTLFFSKWKIKKAVIVVATLMPIVVFPTYLYLYNSRFSDFTFMGKQFFSGRESTYKEILAYIETPVQMIFGNIGAVRFQNAHNAALSVMCSIGILGMIIVYLVYVLRFFQVSNNADTPKQRVALVCILATFIQSSAEALMLTGHFSGMLFMYIYVQMARGKMEKGNEKCIDKTSFISSVQSV